MTETDTYKYKGVRVTHARLLVLLGERAYIEFVKRWSDNYKVYEIIKEDKDGVHTKYLYGMVRQPRKRKPELGVIDVLSDGVYTLSKLREEIESGAE